MFFQQCIHYLRKALYSTFTNSLWVIVYSDLGIAFEENTREEWVLIGETTLA